ncbi:MAG TPA: nitroreductase family protein [Acidimicrobiia bacterium]|nr:nitroreductase family protein [Acidimicrobiia bacterium]
MQPDPHLYKGILRLRVLRHYQSEPISDEDLSEVLEAGRWTGTSKNRQLWSVVVVRDPQQRDRLAETGNSTDPIRRAPVTLVLVQEPEAYEFDVGRVAQNMMLAASALGIATCPITLHRPEDAAAVLGLPEGRKSLYAIAMGYPSAEAEVVKRGGRKPVDEFVHHDSYAESPLS